MATPLSNKLDWAIANPIWSAALNPVLANPLNNMSVIENFQFKAGTNIIAHHLGHLMQGWFIVDIQGIATIFRSAPMNSLTLTLTVSAPVIASIGVY